MRKISAFLISLLCIVLLQAVPALAEETAEWTVMFYLCGSDLESRHGLASGNLEEILEWHTIKTLIIFL